MKQKFISKMINSSRIAAKAVVRLRGHGYCENQIQSILDPRSAFSQDWIGSGFFIKLGNKPGYILTNCHVARNARHLEIQSLLTSDESFRVEIVGLVDDMEPDVALLQFSRGELKRFLEISKTKCVPYLSLGNSKKILRSEEVRAIGYPLGMDEPNVSSGEISNFIAGTDEMTERLVTSAPINPGNSGGPSINKDGKVIGINTSLAVNANNIGFITPAHLIKKTILNIRLKHPTGLCQLAVTVQKNSLNNSQLLGMKLPVGVIVRKVFPKGLGEALGLRPKDVILSINGIHLDRHGNLINEKLARKRNLYDVLHEIPNNQPVRISVFRTGKIINLKSKVVLWPGEGFPSQPILKERQFIYFEGLLIQEVCIEIAEALSSAGADRELVYQEFLQRKSKLIVTHISDDTTASALDLSLGDFVVQVRGKSVKNLIQLRHEIIQALKSGSESLIIDFSSGAIGNFPTSSLKSDSAVIRKFGEKIEP